MNGACQQGRYVKFDNEVCPYVTHMDKKGVKYCENK